jgi:hypothetical protein
VNVSERSNGWRAWALGLFVTMSGTFGMWAWSATVDRVTKLEVISSERGERIAITETELKNLRESAQRIESKIDQILQRQQSK